MNKYRYSADCYDYSIIDNIDRNKDKVSYVIDKKNDLIHTMIDDEYIKFQINKRVYYYNHRQDRTKKGTDDYYCVYIELPLVVDDKNFVWKKNRKYNSTEATIVRGNFEYLCVVNADGNGKVLVRYNKCENYHRNRVTIAEFNVENAYNEKFLEAIDKWTKEFKESIAA